MWRPRKKKMKKNYSIIILFTFWGSSLYSQNKNKNPISKDTLQTQTTSSFSNMVATETIKFGLYQPEWKNENQSLTTYNANGDKVHTIEKIFHLGKWINNRQTNWDYNSAGQLMVERYEIAAGSGWENATKSIFTYNSKGKLISQLNKLEYERNKWKIEDSTYFEYDTTVNSVTEINLAWIDKKYVLFSKCSKILDLNENVLTELQQEVENGVLSIIRQFIYEYDKEKIISETFQLSLKGVLENQSQDLFSYDSNGKVITLMKKEWNGDKWVDIQKISYEYDEKGNQLKEQIFLVNESSFINKSVITRTYDEKNRLIEEICLNWNQTKWQNFCKKEYSYNTNSKVSK